MNNFTHASLFSGIGGFDLAATWCGWENIFQVENDSFCQKVLTKNFPDVPKYLNIEDFNGDEYKNAISVISGGFPCQPFSSAGKRKGVDDERYLWGEMFRVIKNVAPPYVVAENVLGLLTNQNGMAFKQVLADLESEKYETLVFVLPAIAQNAPHIRNRVFFVAYSESADALQNFRKEKRRQAQQFGKCFEQGNFANANSSQCERKQLSIRLAEEASRAWEHWNIHWSEWSVKPTICRGDDGISLRLDRNRRNRIKALGNAVVPQVVYQIFKAIQETI